MASLNEYLLWRGDLPFTRDPFNEVDNLVFAELAYVRFEGMVSTEIGEETEFRHVGQLLSEKFTPEALNALPRVEKRATALFLTAAETERFGHLTLSGYRSITETEQNEQMAVVTFHLPGNVDYVAFRGTDTAIVGWKEDFMLSYRMATEGQRHSAEYMDECFLHTDRDLFVGGHSKGGNLAVYASAFSDPSLKERIITVFSNDGPGFREEVTEEAGYREILPKVVRIVPEDTIVSALLSSSVSCRVVKSADRGPMQHQATGWQVQGAHFVYGERSSFSLSFEKIMKKWLAELGPEELEDFTEYVFTVLELTGATTITDIQKDLFGSAKTLFSSIDRIPKDKQARFFGMLQQLFRVILQG